ncbi:MAG: nitroreductase family protein, partial [Pseudomonadota bacterium]
MSLFSVQPYRGVSLPERPDQSDADLIAQAAAFQAAMGDRRSVRDFTDRPVPEAVIATAIATAGGAPSGANHQPWHFAATQDADKKAKLRAAAETEERDFYAGGAGAEWLAALEPIGTDARKPHLTVAPWLIVVFAQWWSTTPEGVRFKNYYVPESVVIATGFLIASLHHAGLSCLTHTPNPMKFLNDELGRPSRKTAIEAERIIWYSLSVRV